MTEEKFSNNENSELPEKRGFYFLFFAGILLPAVTFFVEIGSRWCATEFFDPMPTWWHAFFVFFVPATNLQTWLAIRKGSSERLGWLSFANAAAIFISLFYTIIFAPIMPIAAIGILLMLIGLLPLAPFFSLIATVLMRRRLRKLAPAQKSSMLGWKGLAAGFIVVLVGVTLAEIPFTLTKIGIEKANSENVEQQNEGLAFLKRFGNKDYLLRLCYANSGFVTTDVFSNFIWSGKPFQLKIDGGNAQNESFALKAQKAFYRLTGKQYRQIPTPRGMKNWERFETDDFVDETESSRINHGLLLVGSQMDGSVDGDAALGYLEWTLVFRNEKSWQQEAISQIQLPPNAVVSRLTLWINGEEREAAFAKSAKVIEAYNAVTAKRRDPALLTTTGKDRVQLKCFPVPPGGEMKVRIGVTMPLVLENETSGLMPMPYFQDRNFSVPAQHSIWIESKKEVEIANPEFIHEKRDKIFAVRGSVKNEDLIKIGSPVRVQKSANVKISWAKDAKNPQNVIKQEIKESILPRKERVVFVVDTSAQMKPFQTEISEAFRNLSPEIETALILTGGNGLNVENSAPNFSVGNPAQTAEIISNAAFDGGTDGVPAIEKAWQTAQEKTNSAIIWIHAPQPLEINLPTNLTHLWTRRPNSVPVYSLQVRNGKDVVERVLNESNALETVPRFGSLRDDLSRLLSRFDGQNKIFEAVRTTETASKISGADAKETSQHLVRLWASDEVKRLLVNREDEKAIDLAVKNQLVTQVSGAVVLETQQQYDQFGLKPVDANSVPTIPEPEEYLLFGVVLAVLLWFARQMRRKRLQTV